MAVFDLVKKLAVELAVEYVPSWGKYLFVVSSYASINFIFSFPFNCTNKGSNMLSLLLVATGLSLLHI